MERVMKIKKNMLAIVWPIVYGYFSVTLVEQVAWRMPSRELPVYQLVAAAVLMYLATRDDSCRPKIRVMRYVAMAVVSFSIVINYLSHGILSPHTASMILLLVVARIPTKWRVAKLDEKLCLLGATLNAVISSLPFTWDVIPTPWYVRPESLLSLAVLLMTVNLEEVHH